MTLRAMTFLGMGLSGLAVSVAIGIAIGAGGYTYHYGEGLSYLSDDPKGCVNCHIMREHYDGWAKSSHHAVATCNDCHTPHDLVGKYLVKAENGFWHSKSFTLQDFRDPLVIRPRNSVVLQNSCVHCHGDVAHNVLAHAHDEVSGAAGRVDGGAASCVRCHRSVGHGPDR